MAQQCGLKHAATEPLSLDAKREPRRRGAAGRAAALRRAPSDSDCSGETASLSADSAERVRPLPPPPRVSKTRSRRRGSEWEVLEGLKDGQRFERRPEVFNGYLHKKRKWPLKGWHKRFFVVDGGILVYARSPTDVARGRLHGSVDVGLSVISAKARRRRIDIDADEFIYHLRAKTADVFRTWLNVLKTHRLYRQHLLTFGARESVPKIHAPLEDLPPTDNSSRSTTTFSTSSGASEEEIRRNIVTAFNAQPSLSFVQQIICYENHQNTLTGQSFTHYNVHENENATFKEEDTCDTELQERQYFYNPYNHSLCSMNCLTQIYAKALEEMKHTNENDKVDEETKEAKLNQSSVESRGVSMLEQQINSTNLEFSSTDVNPYTSSECSTESNSTNCCRSQSKYNKLLKKLLVYQLCNFKKSNVFKHTVEVDTKDSENRTQKPISPPHVGRPPPKPKILQKISTPTKIKPFSMKPNQTILQTVSTKSTRPFKKSSTGPTTLYVLSKRNVNASATLESPMRKSKKCTNLVKYKNQIAEPLLSKCYIESSILNPNKKVSKQVGERLLSNTVSQGMQISRTSPKHKAVQDRITLSERDRMAEKLFISIFKRSRESFGKIHNSDIKAFLNQTVMELYEVKSNHEKHPVKMLFKSLLDYWIDNTAAHEIRKATKRERSVETQVQKLTRDQALSRIICNTDSRETQYRSVDMQSIGIMRANPSTSGHKPVTYSFFKERRIQELERLLKNTIYTYEAVCNNPSKHRDIQITKKLIDNLEGAATLTTSSYTLKESISSTEFPQMHETLKHLLSDTSIPSDVAKEFLQAYLQVLTGSTDESSRECYYCKNHSSSDDWKTLKEPTCDVQTEAVERKASVGVVTTKQDTKKMDKAKTDPNKKLDRSKLDTNKKVDNSKIDTKNIFDKTFSRLSDSCHSLNRFNNVREMISTIFNKKSAPLTEDRLPKPDDTTEAPNELCPPSVSVANFIRDVSDIRDDNTIVIDLTGFNLQSMSMSEQQLVGSMSLNIELKELPANFESNQKNVNLKFSSSKGHTNYSNRSNSFGHYLKNKIPIDARRSFKNPYLDFNPSSFKKADWKNFLKSNPTTSKGYATQDSERSLEFLTNRLYYTGNSIKDDLSCYLMPRSFKRPTSCFKSKKKSRTSNSPKSERKSPAKDIQLKSPKKKVSDILKKPVPEVIDESFIMLLLENLTQLSRKVPTVHKDINDLYNRLKKKHKTGKSQTTLLGKSNTPTEVSTLRAKSISKPLRIESASNMHKSQKTCGSTNTDTLKNEERGSQTTQNEDFNEKRKKESLQKAAETGNVPITFCNDDIRSKSPDLLIIDSVASDPSGRWNRKDCSIIRAFKQFLDSEDSRNFRFILPSVQRSRHSRYSPRSRTRLCKIDKEHLRESLEHRRRRQVKDKLKKDFSVYQIYTATCMRSHSSMYHSCNDDLKTIYKCNSDFSYASGLISPTGAPLRGPQAGFVTGTPGGRFSSWIIEGGGGLESAGRELTQAQLSVQQLQRLLEALDTNQQHTADQVSLEGASPNVKKDRRKFGLRKKKSNSKCASIELAPPHVDTSVSHMALSTLTAPPSPGGGACSAPTSAASLPIACGAARPQSLPGAEALAGVGGGASVCSLTPDHQIREDFTVLAKDLVATLKGVVSTLVCERGRLRAAMDAAEANGTAGGVLTALRSNLSSALQQNSELRSRLCRIHDASDLAEISSVNNSDPVVRQFCQSLSYSSSCVSASEFFDAEEHDELQASTLLPSDEGGVIELDGDSSSEAGSLSSEEGSASSDNSDGGMVSAERVSLLTTNGDSALPGGWRRRARLPCPRPTPGGPSLWNLLYKNIGKDLSQVSMPVTINEPLNMLQRLCEELEYSELLDAASGCSSPMERMTLIAAFAVSAYAASAHRAASKPFNPLLAETYECIRSDRGFKFLAEQVSHHPPVSACHAEGPRWVVWQEARIKTKFWGKSMEFQPAGRVHVRLLPQGDHYSWNKVTTCVHNLFGGQRWVDQYGDMHIVCHGTDISAKLNFIKASSWSSSRHEVRGFVSDASSGARVRLQGRWSEGLYAGDPPNARCLWRPGAMPPDHELYYGFTRFAMELNELEPGMREVLPHTDTRLRPDQRALEEGDVESAERHKLALEQAQRERRRENDEHTPAWFRKALEGDEEMWVFTGEYWRAREAGFTTLRAPRIW